MMMPSQLNEADIKLRTGQGIICEIIKSLYMLDIGGVLGDVVDMSNFSK